MAQEKVSFILPCFNSAKSIQATLDSISSQTYTDFECIAIDDGSADETLIILQQHAVVDKRFRVITRENRGLIITLNEAIEASSGEWIARIDSDDINFTNRLEKQIKFANDNSLDICGSGANYFGDKNFGPWYGPEQHDLIKYSLLFCNPICHPSVIIRSTTLRRIGGYSETAKFVEDYELWCRAVSMNCRIGNLQECTINYRTHGNQTTRIHQDAMRESFQFFRERYLESILNFSDAEFKTLVLTETAQQTGFRHYLELVMARNQFKGGDKKEESQFRKAYMLSCIDSSRIKSIGPLVWIINLGLASIFVPFNSYSRAIAMMYRRTLSRLGLR